MDGRGVPDQMPDFNTKSPARRTVSIIIHFWVTGCAQGKGVQEAMMGC
jgi:hypothetical protein